MKKTLYLIIFLLGSVTTINAAEKRDCSGIKKLSKDEMNKNIVLYNGYKIKDSR